MSTLFNMDSPIMRFLGRLADLMLLNLITLLGCLLIIPAGASITAMHYVLLKMARGKDTYIIRDWWKSFKLNFKQATIIWLVMLVFIAVLGFDFISYRSGAVNLPGIMTILTAVAALILYIVFLYIFPILSRFSNSIRVTLKNSLLMAILGLPRTVAMAVVTALPTVFFLLLPDAAMRVMPLYLVFGMSVPGLICAYLYSPLFARFEPEEKEEAGEELTDDDYKQAARILQSDDVIEEQELKD